MATNFLIDDDLFTETYTLPKETNLSTSGTNNSTLRLEPGLSLRNAQWADLEPVAQLILDVCTHDGDAAIAVPPEELREEWETPGFNLETDAWVVTTDDGRVVGFEEFVNRYAHASLQGDGYVHPDFMGKGIGTTMLRALDRRALKEMELAEPEHRVYIRNGLSIGDTVAREMHEAEGYKPIRFFWRMEITLDAPPPAPTWPDGIELRPFDVEAHTYLLYRAHEEAFSDHWGHTPRSFEEWKHRVVEGEDFDPTLYLVAWDRAEIAGYTLNRYRNDNGWVGTLGVRRLWRKRGLGLALLYHSFGEFYKRGMPVISLGVDASNPTGATRLYKKAGMHVAAEYVSYEKELRPGREPEVKM